MRSRGCEVVKDIRRGSNILLSKDERPIYAFIVLLVHEDIQRLDLKCFYTADGCNEWTSRGRESKIKGVSIDDFETLGFDVKIV